MVLVHLIILALPPLPPLLPVTPVKPMMPSVPLVASVPQLLPSSDPALPDAATEGFTEPCDGGCVVLFAPSLPILLTPAMGYSPQLLIWVIVTRVLFKNHALDGPGSIHLIAD
ncbi:hypothetical protein CWC46_10540 [Prodigiosinella confusarubida]|uniref:Uncharacterized protein n=1 Tax=Serratia sp. (strain ATCC 39006) TaxID=104623 RepID=A0A2I5TIY7_SERS3|nr:hypothetical protein CWC46_10540 [Serratia sp. ATCC 39006]AUH04521.1 hypothetical protein Ser39006_010545 [Serratia sp. ATCC 39006]